MCYKSIVISLFILCATYLLIIFFPTGDYVNNEKYIYLQTLKNKVNTTSAILVGKELNTVPIIPDNSVSSEDIVSLGYKPYSFVEETDKVYVSLSNYLQIDPLWKDMGIKTNGTSTSTTWGYGACGFTCMTMALSSLLNDNTFDPPKMNEHLSKYPYGVYRDANLGYIWSGMGNALKNFNLENKWISKNGNSGLTKDLVIEVINKGGFIICSTRPPAGNGPYTPGNFGHMVLVVGYTKDNEGNLTNTIVQDPNNGNEIRKIWKERFPDRITYNNYWVYDNYLKNHDYYSKNSLAVASYHYPKK